MAPIIRQPTGGGGGLEPADIGVTVQGYDSDLAAIAALSTTGLANRTGAGTWTTDSTSYQPLDSDLTDIAALTTTANGRSLLTASALTAAGLGLTNGAAIDSVGASPLTATTAASTYMPLAGGAFSGAVTSTSSISSRQSANTVQFLVSSGTAQTINWNNGGNVNLDLSSASGNVTLTLQNPVSGATYRIRVQQGATVRNLIFPASTVQSGGGGTTYTGISGVDFLTVYYNGSAYLVQSALNSGFIQPTANAAFTGVTQLAALRLNTYAVIVSNSAPATRTDGSALVAGDFWLNPNTGTIGFWRNPYWLSPRRFASLSNTGISGSTTLYVPFHRDYSAQADGALSGTSALYIHSLDSVLRSSTVDGSNYWAITADFRTPVATSAWTSSTITYNSAVVYQKNTLLQNTALSLASHTNQASITATKVGSPGSITLSLHLSYSEIL